MPQLLVALLLCGSTSWFQKPAAHAELIERVLAVVGGELVMLSDVTAALRFGFIEPPDGEGDPMRAALDALIERRLQVIEVNRYLPPEPREEAIESRLAEMRMRFAGPEAFDAALADSGLTLDLLRSLIREDLRIASYRDQRFGAALSPTEEDVARYYRTHETRFTRDGVLRALPEVYEEARQRLIAERSEALLRDWIEALRRRTVVTILP